MFLGIDLGTSGVKALLIDDGQRLIGEAASRPLDVQRPQRGWSEQDPELWWQAVCEAVDRLAVTHGGALAAVRGVGLSGQMYGATVLDKGDIPLRPAILWNDTRSGQECRELEAREPDLRRIAGRRATPGVTAPKLLWLRRHEPRVFERIRTVLLPKDYIRLKLTGEKASDMWLAMLADSLNVRIAVPAASELGAAFGAARLGLAAATGANPADIFTRPPIVEVIEPDPARAAGYAEVFGHWRALYGPVRAASAALSFHADRVALPTRPPAVAVPSLHGGSSAEVGQAAAPAAL